MVPNGLFAPHVIANGANYNRDNVLSACLRVGGKHVVFVNDWEACRGWLARGGIAAHRVKTDQYNDDDADAHFDAAAYVDHVNFELDVAESALPVEYRKRGVIYLGNELGTGTAARTDAWGEIGVKRATYHRRKVVFGNWAYKNKPPALPRTIAALRANGGWMGFHEGTYAGKPLAADAFADGGIGGFIAWKQQHNIPCWITEFAGSLTAHDGWKALYNNDWRQWAAQIEWSLKHVYAPHNAPVSEFTLPVWDLGRGFEMIDVPELLDELGKLNRSYTFMTQPGWTNHNWGQRVDNAVVGLNATINIRANPDENSADVGDLKNGDTVSYWNAPYTGTNYVWYKVLSGGVERYVADIQGLKFVVPPPVVEKRYSFTEAQLIELRLLNARVKEILDSAEEVAVAPAPTFSAAA